MKTEPFEITLNRISGKKHEPIATQILCDAI